ncbi:MAG: hypothetical protein M0D55_11065 [Elusimicrobiota bacterium]|nr:MAG: hypothetical protein M0D55_11065 [Elusimicrobiota bacterium]
MRAASLAALVLLAACAGPKPCTRTLCVARLDGTMRLDGWEGSVVTASRYPQPPVVNDAVVTMVFGSAAFVNGNTLVKAQEGSSFKFTVSTRAASAIEVSSGTVTVTPYRGVEALVPAGVPYALPKP